MVKRIGEKRLPNANNGFNNHCAFSVRTAPLRSVSEKTSLFEQGRFRIKRNGYSRIPSRNHPPDDLRRICGCELRNRNRLAGRRMHRSTRFEVNPAVRNWHGGPNSVDSLGENLTRFIRAASGAMVVTKRLDRNAKICPSHRPITSPNELSAAGLEIDFKFLAAHIAINGQNTSAHRDNAGALERKTSWTLGLEQPTFLGFAGSPSAAASDLIKYFVDFFASNESLFHEIRKSSGIIHLA